MASERLNPEPDIILGDMCMKSAEEMKRDVVTEVVWSQIIT